MSKLERKTLVDADALETRTCIHCPTTAPDYECPICRERHVGMSYIQMLLLHSYGHPKQILSLALMHQHYEDTEYRKGHTTILDIAVATCNSNLNRKKLPNMPLSAKGDINIETIHHNAGGLIGKVKGTIPIFGH